MAVRKVYVSRHDLRRDDLAFMFALSFNSIEKMTADLPRDASMGHLRDLWAAERVARHQPADDSAFDQADSEARQLIAATVETIERKLAA